MTQELTTQELPITQNIDHPMTAGELTKQALLVQDILEKVMVEDVHYGIIPGTGNKKTLYQPGAEKICSTFHLAPKYAVEDLSEPHNNFYRYRVICSLYTIRDGMFVGSACGEASTAEEKYTWQRAICQEQFDDADPGRRRKKFNDDGTFIQQVQRNAADLANTILKMSCKRAFVSATRGATAASDLLEVDLDEEAVAALAKEQRGEQEQPAAKPKAKAKPAPAFSYGKFKGKLITDTEIPLDYLQFMADSAAKSIDDPAKAKFKAQNQLFVAALDAEIASRKKTPETSAKPGDSAAGTAEGDTQATSASNPAQDRVPFSEQAWAEFIRMWEDEWFDLYAITKESFKVTSGHDIPKDQRFAFYDRMNDAIAKATTK